MYAVASEDMDSLTFGAPKFLRHLMEPTSRKLPVVEFDVSKVKQSAMLQKCFVFCVKYSKECWPSVLFVNFLYELALIYISVHDVLFVS